ncbi:MAG: tetratricopeptide repeat protein [Verrucomicrobiota bacterium]
MNTDPLLFEFPILQFDLSLLPIAETVLKADPVLLTDSIVRYLTERFQPLGGTANILVRGDRVAVSWVPASGKDADKLLEYAVSLLRRRAFTEAEAILRGLLKSPTPPVMASFNLGMLLSDQGRLDEAVELLEQVVEERPSAADAWNALGIALQRKGDRVRALEAIERSHELDPDNPYTLRNLGALLANESPKAGLPYLKRAAELLPTESVVAFGYAQALLQCGETNAADQVFQNVIRLAPYSEIARRAQEERTRLAELTLRERGGEVRMDVVMYISGALKLFGELGTKATQALTVEIALLGSKGLDINDPTAKYELKSLPGKFSGLHLLAYLYAGLQQVAPGKDAGIDFSKEYEMAKQMR